MKSEIKWPAWVWHEKDAATWCITEPLHQSFGHTRATAVVWSILKGASLAVSSHCKSWMYLPEMWRAMTPAQRRRAWRLAMEMLGYTEVCDA